MTPYLHSYLVDIRGGRAIRRESTPLGGGDALADKYVVQLMDGTQAVSLTGATVTADVLRPDGKTVSVVGQVVDGAAVVTLDKYCYAVYGEVTISIRAIARDVAQTLLCVRAMVTKASTDLVVDNGLIGNLTELIQAILAGGGGSGGGASAWYVTLKEDGTADKTFAEIALAHEAGNIVMCRVDSETTPAILALTGYIAGTIATFGGHLGVLNVTASFTASGDNQLQMTQMPIELPNPNSLTFTGAVSATYDGSSAVTVDIPRGGNVTLTPNFANSVEECTDTSLVYVLPDGYIYAYMATALNQPEIVIEEKAGGYWYGNSYNPTGTWTDGTNMSGKRTNIFAVTPGDQLSYRGYGYSTPDSVVWLDENQVYLSDAMYDARVTPVTVTVPEGAAYAWFNSFEYTPDVDGVVLEVKWILCQASSMQYQWTNTGHAFVTADNTTYTVTVSGSDAEGWTADKTVGDVLAAYETGRTIMCQLQFGIIPFLLSLASASATYNTVFFSSYVLGKHYMVQISGGDSVVTVTVEDATADVLAGKKIIYDGDSIAESRLASNANGGGYAKIIADLTGGSYVNQAVGGARLCASSDRHSVVDNLANLPTDGHLYCFEGGINDFWANTPIGEVTTGYTDNVDPTTICGAMETIFRYCLTNLLGKPVCFVIVHKVQNTAISTNGNGDTFTDYHDAMVKVCRKYSIPYYDAFLESGLNGWNDAQSNSYLTANSSGTGDGIHPNEEGYRRYYAPQMLALFRAITV